MKLPLACLCALSWLSACAPDEGRELAELPTPLEGTAAGGATTVYSDGPDAFTFPLSNLDEAGVVQHFEADGAFGQQFVTAPAEQFAGLGPLFNQNSCENCHTRNGRGALPTFPGDPNSGFLLRLSVPGDDPVHGTVATTDFGRQLQTKAVYGFTPEGRISKVETDRLVEFLDGTSLTLKRPTYGIAEAYTDVPADLRVSPRIPPPVHGLGLIEAIGKSDLLAHADPDDLDGDGISGRPNRVYDPATQRPDAIGLYGWKAGQSTALAQAADAARNDMGLTNRLFREESCGEQANCAPALADSFDLDDASLGLMAFYFQTVAVPAARDLDDPRVILGGRTFAEIGCASCHVPSYVTGDHAIAALTGQTIFPYSDLLLHDMGEGLADGRGEFAATGTEWRTSPLWGIGLTQVVNARATFLHDGRAATLEEAILWHGGEAQAAQDAYRALPLDEREAVVAFLEAL